MVGLLDQSGDGAGWDIDPALLQAMASDAGTPTWTPASTQPPDATIAPTTTQPPGATMADASPAPAGGGFLSGAQDAISNIGLALGGNVDPSITGAARTNAGIRSLLNFGLTMLMNSGPSYTPRNFGQILASGLASAAASNQYTDETRLKQQQIAATYALKAGQLKIQELLAGARGAKIGQQVNERAGVSALAASPPDGAPAAPAAPPSDGTAAPPASASDFLTSNEPVFQDISAKTGLPVEFLRGQAANESAWGTSPAAVQGNNLFGLSDASGTPLRFPTKQAGVDAYVNLLNTKYADVPRTGTPAEIGGALGKAGYNTVAPDYGARVGNFAAMAARLAPAPAAPPPSAAAAPGTQVAGPGAGAAAPSGGAPAPAPSSTPPSVAAPVFETLPPPVLPDVAARRAQLDTAFAEAKRIAAASGNDTLYAKAVQDHAAGYAQLDKDVADARAAQLKLQIEHNAQIAEKQKDREAELVRTNATIQGQKDLETQKAAAASDLQRQTNIGSINSERLKPLQASADQAQGTLQTLDMLDVFAPAIMQGGRDPVAQTHPELRSYLGMIDPGNPDSDKWNAQDIWQKLNANLARADVASFKGRTSNNDLALVTNAQQTLSNDPAMIPIVSGMKRALALRQIQANSLAHDYAALPTPPPGGMDQYINSHLPGYDPKNPLTPPPLFAQPPPLNMAVVANQPNYTDEQMAAAKAVDDPIQQKYVQSQPVGVPFMTWGTRQGPQGDRYTRAWMVKAPDGSVYQQSFPPYQRAK